MKKLLLASSIVFATFATPALAEDCSKMIAEFDTAIQASSVSDAHKMKALEMREQGAKQQAAGDDKSCTEVLAAAMQVLKG